PRLLGGVKVALFGYNRRGRLDAGGEAIHHRLRVDLGRVLHQNREGDSGWTAPLRDTQCRKELAESVGDDRLLGLGEGIGGVQQTENGVDPMVTVGPNLHGFLPSSVAPPGRRLPSFAEEE